MHVPRRPRATWIAMKLRRSTPRAAALVCSSWHLYVPGVARGEQLHAAGSCRGTADALALVFASAAGRVRDADRERRAVGVGRGAGEHAPEFPGDDIARDRQAETGSLPGRLRAVE